MEGFGMSDTPDGMIPSDRMVAAMAAWRGANTVRVPLNEQCWLGLAGVKPEYAGAPYRQAIAALVSRLTAHGFVTILDLHRSAPGSAASREQEQMPDRDHSPQFWASVAGTFGPDPSVVFDLFNEPFPYQEQGSARAWDCWRDGGCSLTSTNSGSSYTAAGMRELVDAVRSTGARNILLLSGIYWAEDLTRWLQERPADPAGQVAASVHLYSFNSCSTTRCYDRELAPVAAQVPLLAAELGPDLTRSGADLDATCPPGYVGQTGFSARTVDWLGAHGAGWVAWAWTPSGDCWALTSDWSGTPTPRWGRLLRGELAAVHR
ncbi:MAG TPA: cellulase family glycosylhydrolase [Kineosporiaceae bacterium]